MRMSRHEAVYEWGFAVVLVSIALFFHLCHGDVGTASLYRTPYLPTACGGGDQTQFPSSNQFAAAGEGIWDNGGSCGRQYKVRCISAAVPRACIPGATVQVKIVDRAQSSVSRPTKPGTTIVLSTAAFSAIVNASVATDVNVEFAQV